MAVALVEPSCDLSNNPTTHALALQPASSSKSSAILGGQPSALELIRLAQESGAAPQSSQDALAATAPTGETSLAPAAGGMRLPRPDCMDPGAALPWTTAKSEDFLASKRVSIGHTAFDRDWQRVSGDVISLRRYKRLLGGAPDSGISLMSTVNAWVNRRIEYTEDRELFARADYWAGAQRTLRLRRGDCEDIALTKMQLLAAAGIARDDMTLTIARDLVRNADHAVLIVRHDGRHYLLDNATDELLDGSLSHDYRPVLSFGSGQTWLHGY